MISSLAKPWRSLAAILARPWGRLGALLVLVFLTAAAVNLWAWYQVREADHLVQRYHFPEAYAHYARGLRVWRWSAALHFQAGRTARRAGLEREAEHHLEECQRLQGGASAAALPLALERLLLQAQFGDIDVVEEPLWKYVEKDRPETPLVLEALARGYVRVFRLGTALRCLQRILRQEPENVEALVLAGKSIEKGAGKKEEAVKDYRRALEIDPERDDARLSLALILLRDHPLEARSHLQDLVARHPDNWEMMLALAQAQRALGDADAARPLLERVLAAEPANSTALTELGLIALSAGQPVEAEAQFRKAIAADPANRTAHSRLCQSLLQQPGKEKDAADQLDRYERVEKDLTRLGEIASKEMSKAPHDPQLHYELGVIYLRYGKPEVGVRWLQSALRLDPRHQPSQQALAAHYQKASQQEAAPRPSSSSAH